MVMRTLQIGKEALLVESGALETEGVDNVVDLDLGVVKLLLSLLSGGVGTGVDLNGTLGDHSTVDFVDNVLDELGLVGVRDHLVAGEDILRLRGQLLSGPWFSCPSPAFILVARGAGSRRCERTRNEGVKEHVCRAYLENNHGGGCEC